jgi:hypothetical protein
MSGLGDVTFYNDDVTVGMVMKTVLSLRLRSILFYR